MSEQHTLFPEFLESQTNKNLLRGAYEVIDKGYSNMYLRALKLKYSNALSSTSFSNAWCDLEECEEMFTLGSIFCDGLDALDNCIKGNLPEQKTPRKALQKLFTFLNSSIDDLQENHESDECSWTVELAQRLLSQLAVGSTYTIDCHSRKLKLMEKHLEYLRPCGKDDTMVGSFGDTSFGCVEGWHGSADILMENIPITIVENQAESDSQSLESSNDGYDSTEEGTITESFSSQDINQEIAQCIAFAFLQNKKCDNEEKYDKNMTNYLIPSLGFSKGKVHAIFYDCEKDVLLKSCPVDIFRDSGQKNISTIMFIWLTLNYKWFCSGVTQIMMQDFPNIPQSNFIKLAGPCLTMYKNDVQRPAFKPCSKVGNRNVDFVSKAKEDPDRVQRMTYIPMIPHGHTPSSSRQRGCPGSKRAAPQDSGGSPTPKRSHSDTDPSD